MMARIGYQQSFAMSVAVRERLQYSSAQAFESRFVLRRNGHDGSTIRFALSKHRRRKSRKVALIQYHDVTNVCDLTKNKAIFIQERFRAVDDHNQKIGVRGFSLCTRDANRFDLVAGTSDAGGINEQDWNAVYSDRLGQCISRRSRNASYDGSAMPH